jgi:hypothetical protein
MSCSCEERVLYCLVCNSTSDAYGHPSEWFGARNIIAAGRPAKLANESLSSHERDVACCRMFGRKYGQESDVVMSLIALMVLFVG